MPPIITATLLPSRRQYTTCREAIYFAIIHKIEAIARRDTRCRAYYYYRDIGRYTIMLISLARVTNDFDIGSGRLIIYRYY